MNDEELDAHHAQKRAEQDALGEAVRSVLLRVSADYQFLDEAAYETRRQMHILYDSLGLVHNYEVSTDGIDCVRVTCGEPITLASVRLHEMVCRIAVARVAKELPR